MVGNVELLNYIHQNSEMGLDTIKHLIDIAKDEGFKKTLQSQLEEYQSVYDNTNKKLQEFNKEAKNSSMFSKASSYIMINLNTVANKTPSHISEMLIKGSTLGIVDITKKMKEYRYADQEILDLATKLLRFEEHNVEECKKYLQ